MVQILDENALLDRPTVLKPTEENMVSERQIDAASQGFPVGIEAVKDMMSRIAADGLSECKHGTPSDDAVRAFRSWNKEIKYRKSESKEHAKLRAEDFSHVDKFFNTLQRLSRENEGLLINPNRIVNFDETSMDATYRKRQKAFTSAHSHHGGFRGESTTYM